MIGTTSRYMKYYGARATIAAAGAKLRRRVLGHASYTVLLRHELGRAEAPIPLAPRGIHPLLSCGPLQSDEIDQFERRKFFPFVNTEAWISAGSVAQVARIGHEIIGYVWIHPGPKRVVPGLGEWRLDPGERWCGPTFVHPAWRGRGIHGWLLAEVVHANRQVKQIFTAINLENHSSLRGFLRVGFKPIATVGWRRPLLMKASIDIAPLSSNFDIDSRLVY